MVVPPTGQPMDSNQLLSLCERVRDNMSSLDRSIRLTQLRLTTLSYIQTETIEDSSLKCFDNLIELSNLSQRIVLLLDELHLKLSESSESSIDYQIASQQLTFFTSEWYDNFTPKLNETFELASRQEIKLEGAAKERRAGGATVSQLAETVINLERRQRQRQRLRLRRQSSPGAPAAEEEEEEVAAAENIRVREALLRLKQSMRENERLTASIASNIEYTRATIESIYDSLQSTKLGLDAGERQTLEATRLVARQTNYTRWCCFLILLIPAIYITFYLARALLRLFVEGLS